MQMSHQPLSTVVSSTRVSIAVFFLLSLLGNPVTALTISPVSNVNTLVSALQGSNSGITVLPGATLQGDMTTPQSATYDGFNLSPSTGSGPTLALPNGVLLTSGSPNLPLTNTEVDFSNNLAQPVSGGNALLDALSGNITDNANVISFNFSVVSGTNAITARFIFGTEEFPTQAVTDVFGFFVDGVNYARFPNGELISNTPGTPTNFIDNPVGEGLYGIEYNGLTQVFQITGLLNPAFLIHTLAFGVADTNDDIYDSGVFLGDLRAAVADTGGIGQPGVPSRGVFRPR